MKISKIKDPMPTVEYNGVTYKLKSRKTVVPDFSTMESLHISFWLLKNTTPRGYTRKDPNPLTGMGDVIKMV